MKCPICDEKLLEQLHDLQEEERIMAVIGKDDSDCSYYECLKPYHCKNKHTIYIGRGDA